MTFKNLVEQGKIKKIKASKEEIKDIISLADRDINMTEFIISQDLDWAFSISYNAALQISRAYMYSKEYEDFVGFFDRMRPKRNKAIYDTAGLITETEVKELFKKSKEFVRIIKDKLKGEVKNG